MKKILFVCSGNTCRSPMAAALCNALGDSEIFADSAGIGAFWGDGISRGSLDALRFTATVVDDRLPYPEHRSKPVREEDLAEADCIYGITSAHQAALIEQFSQYKDKIFAFPVEISDPYGKDTAVYLDTLCQIRLGIAQIYRKLKNNADGIYPAVAEWDLVDILRIENQSFSTPWSEKSFRMSLDNPITQGIVKILDGKVAGYALYSILFEDGELYNIAVSPEMRNRGVGKDLLQAVISDSFARRAEVLRLEVRVSNAAARHLYETNGFKTEGIRKNYYQNPTEDAILMHLSANELQKETL